MSNHQFSQFLTIDKNHFGVLRPIGNVFCRRCELTCCDIQSFSRSFCHKSPHKCVNIWPAHLMFDIPPFGLNINLAESQLILIDDSINTLITRLSGDNTSLL